MCPPDMYVQVHAESGGSRSILLEGVVSYTNQEISLLACDVLTSILLQLAEVIDLFWAPLSAMLVFQLYGNTLLSGVALLEELLPFTDIFPTATAGWVLQYTVIHMFPSVRPFAIPFTSSISLCLCICWCVLVVAGPIFVLLSVSPSDVFDNRHKRKPLYLSGFLYTFMFSFRPSIFHSSSECMYFPIRRGLELLVYQALRGLNASE